MGPAWRWLVVYGGWLSALAVLAAAVTGAWLAPRVRRRWTSWRLRSRMGPTLREIPAGHGFVATLAGTLDAPTGDGPEGPVVATAVYGLRADGLPTPSVCGAVPGVVLVLPEGRVRLHGAIEVLYGNPTGRAVDALPLLTGDDSDRGRLRATRVLRAHDRVRVHGAVEVLPTDGEGGYRGARPGWRMVPGAEGRILAAYDGTSRTDSVSQHGVGAVVAALSCIAVMTLLGTAALALAVRGRGPLGSSTARVVCAGRGQEWAALAGVSLVHRHAALDLLSETLLCGTAWDPGAARTMDAVARGARMSCAQHAAALEDLGAWADAATRWQQCGSAENLQRAMGIWYGLGEYAQASRLIERTPGAPDDVSWQSRALRTHLLAGRTEAAVPVAERLQAVYQRRADRGQGDEDEDWSREAQGYACVVDALKAQGGDARARARLVDRPEDPFEGGCAELSAEAKGYRPQVHSAAGASRAVDAALSALATGVEDPGVAAIVRQGDGAVVASWLRHRDGEADELRVVALRAARHLRRGRGALEGWLMRDDHWLVPGAEEDTYEAARLRLAIAEVLGSALATTLRPVLDRQEAAIHRRETAVLLGALDGLEVHPLPDPSGDPMILRRGGRRQGAM